MKPRMSKDVAKVLKTALDDIRELCGRLEEEGQDTGDFTITVNDIQEILANWKGICLHGYIATWSKDNDITCRDCGKHWNDYDKYRRDYKKAEALAANL